MKAPEDLQLMLQKALVATLAGLLALMLVSALLIGGFVMLLVAMVLGLTPWVGEASAYAITGLTCMLLLLLIFRGLMPKPKRRPRTETAAAPDEAVTARTTSSGAPLDSFREIIREHPWDSVAASFALGYAHSRDPRLKEILIESGLAYVRSGALPGAEPKPKPKPKPEPEPVQPKRSASDPPES